MVSIKDVARLAEVSVGTVSNVLNRPASVTADRREKVEWAIAQLGFVRSEAARQLRAGTSRTIAVVVLDIANPFFTDLIAGAERVAEDNDALVVVCNSGGSAQREARHLARLAEQRVLGILLSPVDDKLSEELLAVGMRGVPVVLVDRVTRSAGLSGVAVDDVLGGSLAGAHLIATGHQRIAFVGGPLSLRQVSDRLEGLRSSAPTADLQVLESGGMSVDAGAEACARLLEIPAPNRPTAVFCANDLLALGVLNECTRRGIPVPTELSIVGYDDISFAATAGVPLTSVRQPRELQGRTAAELLLNRLTDGAVSPPRHVLFQPELVVRNSTRRARDTARSVDAGPAAQVPRPY